MPDYVLHVDPEELLTIASGIDSNVRTIRATFSEAEQRIKQTASYWTGSAAEMNRTLFQGYIPDIEEMESELEGHSTALTAIAREYSGTQAEMVDSVEELPGDVIP